MHLYQTIKRRTQKKIIIICLKWGKLLSFLLYENKKSQNKLFFISLEKYFFYYYFTVFVGVHNKEEVLIANEWLCCLSCNCLFQFCFFTLHGFFVLLLAPSSFTLLLFHRFFSRSFFFGCFSFLALQNYRCRFFRKRLFRIALVQFWSRFRGFWSRSFIWKERKKGKRQKTNDK